MAKSWREVEQTSNYQQLSFQDKKRAKQEYWNSVVIAKPEFQNLSGKDKNVAKQEFLGSKQPDIKPNIEERIAQRPDAYQTLQKEVMQPWQPRQHPFGTAMRPLVTGLKAAAVPIQRGFAGLASAGLEAQKQQPIPPEDRSKTGKVMLRNIKQVGDVGGAFLKGLSGQRQAELGDIVRTTGWGGKANEMISATTGLFASMGILNLATKGQLINSTKKASAFVKSKTPKVMNKNYVVDRANQASDGMDDLYKGLSKEYDGLYKKIGNIQKDSKQIQAIIDDLPQGIINKISKSNLIGWTRTKEIVPDMNNLKAIKTIIRQSVPTKVWNGKAIGDMNTAQLEQAYGKISNIMAEGNTPLQNLNTKYGNFMQMRRTLGRVLYDVDGNIKSKGLEGLFKSGAERSKQLFFEKFAQQWPQAQQIMKDIIKFNKRQSLRHGVGTALKYGILFEGGRRLIAKPLMKSLENIGGGDTGGSSQYQGQ